MSARLPVVVLALSALFVMAAPAGRAQAPPVTPAFERDVRPVLAEICTTCHNAKDREGGLDLTPFLDPGALVTNRKDWDYFLARVRAGEMPPSDGPILPDERRTRFVRFLDAEFARADRVANPDGRPNPGRVTVRRLNRFEYNNTIRDLLGVRIRASEDFPPDPFGYGFNNIGDVLTLSPVLTEQYLKAAERVAKVAIPPATPWPVLAVRYNAETMGQRDRLHIQAVHDFPIDGVYTIRGAWEELIPYNTTVTGIFAVDGKEVARIPYLWENYNQDRGIDAPDIRVKQGAHTVDVEFQTARAQGAPGDQVRRNGGTPTPGAKPYVIRIEIGGPYQQTKAEDTESYKRVFFKGPPANVKSRDYAREILTLLTRKAYRRPVTKEDVNPLLNLFTMVRGRGGSFEDGIRVALEAVLVSPKFLFRIEQDPPGAAADYRVSDLELASRLSYFLWSSMPDEALLALAERGTLHDPAVLRAQVTRMLADAKVQALAADFSGQWLQTTNLETIKPDAQLFPEFDVFLRDAMRTETQMFFSSLIAEDRSVLDIVDAKYTFVNDRLAALYGIPNVTGREFRRVELDGVQRSGVITHAGVLAVTSYPTRTSPVIRGKWVLETMLNAAPPPPPPNVPSLEEKKVTSAASMREQLEQHRSATLCASCHSRMDPLGFGLERYDAIGRWRTTDGGVTIDDRGTLPDGRTFAGAAELKTTLKGDTPRFVRALSDRMLTYAMGRGIEAFDRPAVEGIARRVEQNGYRFSELVEATVESVPFQQRTRVPVEAAAIPARAERTGK